ncbi:adenine phosphoribosyltransferase [Candidatus Saccharibacteria bacterium]|nr:adenine phosphoribosyltransferase [Candidatus Saccharibacteria bacterium]
MSSIQESLRIVPDFPEPGIDFYDIAPLLADHSLFSQAVSGLVTDVAQPTHVAGFDARGFLLATPVAQELGVGMVMLRKPGKLPGETERIAYDLEYGQNELEIQSDLIGEGDRVLLVDDVIATGGTACAGIELVRRAGAEVIGFHALIDIVHLLGSERIKQLGVPVHALVEVGVEHE